LKVAVSASGPSLDASVDLRFGRCAYFVIVETDNMQFEAIPNSAQYAGGGAGIQPAQTVASKGVQAVLTGNVGLNAYQALSAAGIQIVTGAYGTVREAVMRHKQGELRSTSSPTAPMHYGMEAATVWVWVKAVEWVWGEAWGEEWEDTSSQHIPELSHRLLK